MDVAELGQWAYGFPRGILLMKETAWGGMGKELQQLLKNKNTSEGWVFFAFISDSGFEMQQ